MRQNIFEICAMLNEQQATINDILYIMNWVIVFTHV